MVWIIRHTDKGVRSPSTAAMLPTLVKCDSSVNAVIGGEINRGSVLCIGRGFSFRHYI
jgi:hypothetical protein